MESEIDKLARFGQAVTLYGKDVVSALLILVVGLIAVRLLTRYLRRTLPRFIENQKIVSTFMLSLQIVLLVVVVALAAHQAGVDPLVIRRILLAATLIAVGLVVLCRPYLPNLPYKTGNMVEVAGKLGIVEATTFLNTRLRTFDGKVVFIPNRMILNDVVINYHFTPNRHIRIAVSIHYRDDLLKAKAILAELLAEDPRILGTPAARVFVLNLGDNGVELAAWSWVKNVDYWRTRCDMLEKIKLRFDQKGITIPFPQRDVHIYQEAPQSETRDL